MRSAPTKGICKKLISQSILEKMRSNLLRILFLIALTLKDCQTYVKTSEKSISARLIAKQSPSAMVIWKCSSYNAVSKKLCWAGTKFWLRPPDGKYKSMYH